MTPWLLDFLVDPDSGSRFQLREFEGSLQLAANGVAPVPIIDGIPRFVASEEFTETFGWQWNRYEVAQPGEDEETFELKTGVSLSSLAGMDVLDAGCGGGRYTRIVARHASRVVAVDRSQAVAMTRRLTSGFGNVGILQADLTRLPLRPEAFDLVFSIGVLHHSPSTLEAFRSIAKMVKPGGRLSVWLYRKNSLPQEVINDVLRSIARRLPRKTLESLCKGAAVLGGIPVLNRTLNKVANFSNHPHWVNRVCDNFDWYSPQFQHHHTFPEVAGWYKDEGFEDVRELPPGRNSTLYCWAFRRGLIVGSGVNVTGLKIRR